MTTPGSRWRNRITLQATARQGETAGDAEQRQLEADLACIDGRVEIAILQRAEHVRIMTRELRHDDAAPGQNLDGLARVSRRSNDFAVAPEAFVPGSAARAIAEACALKNLVCFVVRTGNGLPDSDNYHLHARPL